MKYFFEKDIYHSQYVKVRKVEMYNVLFKYKRKHIPVDRKTLKSRTEYIVKGVVICKSIKDMFNNRTFWVLKEEL